jgi:orotidine-5'-phosphate decarboxylase
MINAAYAKKSTIVLALDPPINSNSSNNNGSNNNSSSLRYQDLRNFTEKTISAVEQHICAIKMNFHLILPLSACEILQINNLAHSYGLQSIADIKLNDIENTNEIAVEHLVRMGFDAIIANPFMGKGSMKSLVLKAHKANAGLIALVYMSHIDASEGFGLATEGGKPLYKIFLERAREASADGIVVGATQTEILKQVAEQGLPVYSPGIGAQGGDIEKAIKSGADYLIIGRLIIAADQPAKIAKEVQSRILAVSK